MSSTDDKITEYRSKSHNITAVQLTKENANRVALWCGGRIVTEMDVHDPEKTFVGVNYPTTDGSGGRVSEGSYLVKTESGEFQHYAPDMFKMSFEDLDALGQLAYGDRIISGDDPGLRIGDSRRAAADRARRASGEQIF